MECYPGWHIFFRVVGRPVEVGVSHGKRVRLFVRISVSAANTTVLSHLTSLPLNLGLPQLPLLRLVPGARVEVHPAGRHVSVWLSGTSAKS